jgi:hypothetical protein
LREADVGLLGLGGHSATGESRVELWGVSGSEELKESVTCGPIPSDMEARDDGEQRVTGIPRRVNGLMFSDVEGYGAVAQRRVTHRAVRASCGGA